MSLKLIATYQGEPSTKPPNCTIPRQLTIYALSNSPLCSGYHCLFLQSFIEFVKVKYIKICKGELNCGLIGGKGVHGKRLKMWIYK